MSFKCCPLIASRRVSIELCVPAFLLCVHLLSSLSLGQTIRDPRRPSPPNEAQVAQLKSEAMASAFKMLKARRVPFDPNLLVESDWRSRIAPALTQMPEMTQNLRVTEPMGGVYFANLVQLPEHTTLKSDTFILTRELAPEDENSKVNIAGNYKLFIFIIGDSRKYEAMARRPPQDQFLNISVEDSLVLVGIAPLYMGTYHARGNGFFDWRRPE